MEGDAIEARRYAYEEMDRLEAFMVDLLLSNSYAGTDMTPARSRALKQKLIVEHQICALQKRISSTAQGLHNMMTSSEESKDDNNNSSTLPLGSALQIDGSDLSPFYAQLKGVKEFHRKNPTTGFAVDSIDIDSILRENVKISRENFGGLFTGEESCGRFLDLYKNFEEAMNLTGGELKVDYLTYLECFDRPTEYISHSKRSHSSCGAYSNYLDNLISYLKDFLEKTRPLTNLQEDSEELELKFEALNEKYEETEEDIIKTAVESSASLFCKFCDKLFTNSAVFDGHLSGKKHLKAAALASSVSDTKTTGKRTAAVGNSKKTAASKKTEIITQVSDSAREKLIEQRKVDLLKKKLIERKEIVLAHFGEFVKDLKVLTRGNVERRQALTAEERLNAEIESDLEGDDYDDDLERGEYNSSDLKQQQQQQDTQSDEDGGAGRIYNPLKLPLDWEGKPIPFWLWKLHGLGIQFSCEICGNFVYMGRRAFDQHFYEWRHSQGMKCLSVPNTPHFFQITKIDEVKRLWERMRAAAKTDIVRPDMMEECEDATGNVYDRRTFEDLKRQGLI